MKGKPHSPGAGTGPGSGSSERRKRSGFPFGERYLEGWTAAGRSYGLSSTDPKKIPRHVFFS